MLDEERVARVIKEAGKLGTTLSRVRLEVGPFADNEIDLALRRLKKSGRVSFDRVSRRWRCVG